MVFNSIEFLFFFPIVSIMYFIFPKKIRYIWLLIVSYYFCMCWEPKFAVWLFLSTVITYVGGRALGVIRDKKMEKEIQYKKICVAVGVILNLSMLFFYKYLVFFWQSAEWLLDKVNITIVSPELKLILPVGMSFYIFQGIGYLMDVYREEIPVEKNFLRYALFISFFPRLISGPIERSKNLLKQLEIPTHFEVERVKRGMLTFAWGLFLKLVIADRIANVINPIFEDYANYHAMTYIVVIIMYAFQVYFDFEGYSLMAIGCSGILGYELRENFAAPYFSVSIQEFWRRWHMSLTSWFRDYLYIPLGGNRKGKIRKHMNTMMVFLVSGLWHGAGWNFIIWGGLNGFYIVCQDLTKNFRNQIYERLHINTNGFIFKWIARIAVFLMIDFSWLFFRVESLGTAMEMLSMMIKDFQISRFLDYQFWGNFITAESLVLLVLLILIAAFADYIKYKNINMVQKVLEQPWIVRWIIYYVLLAAILFLGAYGEGYEQTQFIYFQF